MEITGNEALTGRSPAKRLLDAAFALARREGSGSAKARRVLIVNDDPAIRLLCAVNLEIEGLVVLEAANGKRGLDQARSEHPDLVVTDVHMPGFSGFDLAEALRNDTRTREIPLIFLSSEAEPANADRARKLGALAYLTKPFDPPALASLVAGELGRAGELKHAPATLLAAVAESHPAA